MSHILFHYQRVEPTTWVYLSSLLMIGLFFKFNRFWSVRNLDLLLLILLAPGLLLVHHGVALQEQADVRAHRTSASPGMESAAKRSTPDTSAPTLDAAPDLRAFAGATAAASGGAASVAAATDGGASDGQNVSAAGELAVNVTTAAPEPSDGSPDELAAARKLFEQGRALERIGYVWLLSVGGLFLLRLLLDPTMVRRPLLEPNLSTGGLIFLGCSLFLFLMANVVTSKPTEDDLQGPRGAAQLMARETSDQKDADLREHGPGYAALNVVLMMSMQPQREMNDVYVVVAKVMAIISHLLIVIGIVAIGYQHFDNLRMGIGAATLYLMLPYTAQMTGRVNHALPAALLVWAVVAYRRPALAGIMIGLAGGVVYYPLFLLPLWVSFYWQRGVVRFVLGVVGTLAVLTMSLVFVSQDSADFWSHVQSMFGLWRPVRTGLTGIWGLGWDPVYRIPVLAAFVALSGTLAIWPVQKNLGTLLSCSAAVMVATQFWHGHGGGLFMAWYLPLALLTIFRPNLEDRIALAVLGNSWRLRRRAA